MLTHILLVTTDGSRPAELQRLFNSIPSDSRILIALLEQSGSFSSLPCTSAQTLRLSSTERIPLSVARNRLLEHLNREREHLEIDANTRLIFSDDDCWYSPEFFSDELMTDSHNTVWIHPAYDPNNGRAFAVMDIRRLPRGSHVLQERLLFCATSIGIDVPALPGLDLRFNENIGLGRKISQGEESLYLFHFLSTFPQIKVYSLDIGPVFHPHKVATTSHNHYSLAYFLGWCSLRGYPFAAKYFWYKLMRSFLSILLRPGRLSLDISRSLAKGFIAGRKDVEKLGQPTAKTEDANG